jgi:hypothetical protein
MLSRLVIVMEVLDKLISKGFVAFIFYVVMLQPLVVFIYNDSQCIYMELSKTVMMTIVLKLKN